jgi:succinate dehydrogenase / fumarate reductase iron-sulfur subunit
MSTFEMSKFSCTLKIRRFSTEGPRAGEAYWDSFDLVVSSTERILDALLRIKDDLDSTLTFRRSCGHGICGSDAMRINGRNRLACKVLLKDLNPLKPITVEPIKGLPVLKDLLVDMEPFLDSYKEILPYLKPAGAEPTTERLQSAQEQADMIASLRHCPSARIRTQRS